MASALRRCCWTRSSPVSPGNTPTTCPRGAPLPPGGWPAAGGGAPLGRGRVRPAALMPCASAPRPPHTRACTASARTAARALLHTRPAPRLRRRGAGVAREDRHRRAPGHLARLADADHPVDALAARLRGRRGTARRGGCGEGRGACVEAQPRAVRRRRARRAVGAVDPASPCTDAPACPARPPARWPPHARPTQLDTLCPGGQPGAVRPWRGHCTRCGAPLWAPCKLPVKGRRRALAALTVAPG